MGKRCELCTRDWRLCPLAELGGWGGRAETNMDDTGPPWWRLDTATAFCLHRILGQDYWKRASESKKSVGSFPSPAGDCVSSGQCGPVSGAWWAQTPKDAWRWTATGDQLSHLHLWYFWVGKEVSDATLNWASRGGQGDFSLGALEETGLEAEIYYYVQRPWWKQHCEQIFVLVLFSVLQPM